MIFGKSKKNKPDAENGLSELCEDRDDDGGSQSAAETSGGYFWRLKDQLSKTRKTFSDGFDKIFVSLGSLGVIRLTRHTNVKNRCILI